MVSLVDIHNLKTHFFTSEGILKAVDGVKLCVKKGETIGLVGESGCGKSVASLSIMRLVSSPGKIISGKIQFNNKDLLKISESDMRKIRGNEISMIFQEPMTSLNPVFTVGDQIVETIKLHKNYHKKEAKDLTINLLELVRIPNPMKTFGDYPHQLSGGMRQRVMIAMALSCNPELLIADEPTTALDVTIQEKILKLLESMKEKFGLSVLFITHDLGIIAQIAQKINVMYIGKIIESGPVTDIFANPLHPYTQGLIHSIPSIEKNNVKTKRLKTIGGALPDPLKLPEGCFFEPRCNLKMDVCKESFPDETFPEKNHCVRCHLYR